MTDLRPILEQVAALRAHHVERARAYGDLEQALLRVLALDESAVEPRQQATAAAGQIVRPEAASPASGQQAGTTKCRRCSKTFQPRRGGKAQRFCSSKCRVSAARRAARAKVEPEVSPIQDLVERPFRSDCEVAATAAVLAPPALPWDRNGAG